MSLLTDRLRLYADHKCKNCIYYQEEPKCMEPMIECEIKDILDAANLIDQLQFDLSEYQAIGTVEECKTRKEWMSLSLDDIRNRMDNFCRIVREEVQRDREFAEAERHKRGRKPKGKPSETE